MSSGGLAASAPPEAQAPDCCPSNCQACFSGCLFRILRQDRDHREGSPWVRLARRSKFLFNSVIHRWRYLDEDLQLRVDVWKDVRSRRHFLFVYNTSKHVDIDDFDLSVFGDEWMSKLLSSLVLIYSSELIVDWCAVVMRPFTRVFS